MMTQKRSSRATNAVVEFNFLPSGTATQKSPICKQTK